MKYLIFLALLVPSLAGPTVKPGIPPRGPLGPQPSHSPPKGEIDPVDDHNITGSPPPEGLDGHPRHRRQVRVVSGSSPTKSGDTPPPNGPRPTSSVPPHPEKPTQASTTHRVTRPTTHLTSSRPTPPVTKKPAQASTTRRVTGPTIHATSSRPTHPVTEKPAGAASMPKSSHPPSTVKPRTDISSRPPTAAGPNLHARRRRQLPVILGLALPKTAKPLPANGQRPTGFPPASGKPPAQASSGDKPGQHPKPRPRRHLKGAGSRPTGSPHLEAHTHQSDATRPSKPYKQGHKDHKG